MSNINNWVHYITTDSRLNIKDKIKPYHWSLNPYDYKCNLNKPSQLHVHLCTTSHSKTINSTSHKIKK